MNLKSTAALLSLLPVLSCTGSISGNSAATETSNRSDVSVGSPAPFQGDWGFASHCGFGHYIGITLVQTGKTVSGNWSDGTNLRGSSGELTGEIRDKRLFVKFCSDNLENNSAYKLCPEMEQVDDYFAIENGNLVWYGPLGDGLRRYAVLRKDPDQNHSIDKDIDCDDVGDTENAS